MGRLENGNGTPTERQRPERMSERELGRLLSAAGNHEGQALMLAVMNPRERYTEIGLHAQLHVLQRETHGNEFTKDVPQKWCERSFVPAGLVQETMYDKERRARTYQKTTYGEEVGTAFAGHMLAFSNRHPDTSLYQLSGRADFPEDDPRSSQRKERKKTTAAPLTRYRIYKFLLSSDLPLRAVDVQRHLQETYPQEYTDEANTQTSLNQHFSQLGRMGIVTYEASTQALRTVTYARATDEPAEPPSTYRKYSSLTEDVRAALRTVSSSSDAHVTIEDVYREIIQLHPEKRQQKKQNLKGTISGILNHLTNEGYATKEVHDENTQSSIQLTQEQRDLLTDFVTTIDNFATLSPEILEEGRALAYDILYSPHQVSQLMDKAKTTSPNIRHVSRKETAERIESLLAQSPRTRKDIQDALLELYGQDLSAGAIRIVLREMEHGGAVDVTKQGNEKTYTRKSGETQNAIQEIVVYRSLQDDENS